MIAELLPGYAEVWDRRRNVYTVQDGTTLALLIDEVMQLRARLAVSEAAIDGAMVDGVQPELCRLERECERLRVALAERGHTDECYSGEIDQCNCPLKVLGETQPEGDTAPPEAIAMRDVGRVVIVGRTNDEAEEYLSERLHNAGVWHIIWIDDPAKAAEHASEIGAVVLTVTADDVVSEFVTHVREDGRRVALAEWCASVNPGRHASDGEDDVLAWMFAVSVAVAAARFGWAVGTWGARSVYGHEGCPRCGYSINEEN